MKEYFLTINLFILLLTYAFLLNDLSFLIKIIENVGFSCIFTALVTMMKESFKHLTLGQARSRNIINWGVLRRCDMIR